MVPALTSVPGVNGRSTTVRVAVPGSVPFVQMTPPPKNTPVASGAATYPLVPLALTNEFGTPAGKANRTWGATKPLPPVGETVTVSV